MSALGQVIKQETIDEPFLTGPGEDIVRKTIQQMQLVKGVPDSTGKDTFPFNMLFGPYVPGKAEQRWADYQRFDWSLRQLPVISVFESGSEDKTSDQGYLNGTIQFQVFWPASQRRSDWSRVPSAFKGALQNFFSSRYVTEMLDELYYIQRPNKVSGLNEYGKVMTWSPNIEGLVESELVSAMVVEAKYRVDLRSWYRALEFSNRTKAEPFATPLSDLAVIGGKYQGVTDKEGEVVEYELDDEFIVHNP